MSFVSRLLNPEVRTHLLVDEGEYVIDEVCRHWITILGPVAMLTATIPLYLSMPMWGRFWGIPFVLGSAMFLWSLAIVHRQHMDRFVITNMRVFRVHGVFNRHTSTMPMARILDISVFQPFIGRLLGYGHLIVESAAPGQGLREVRYIARPRQRDLTIQRVIQRAGPRAEGAGAAPDDQR